MSRSHAGNASPSRQGGILAALFLGVPLAAGFLAYVHYGPMRGTALYRYLSHPLECVEVLMFGAAVGTLMGKLKNHLRERRALRLEVLPAWTGEVQPVSTAGSLLKKLDDLPRWAQTTLIVRRTRAVVEFLHQRGSAVELDDQLRSLADTDAIALESSYGLTRFITWAIPILGFLGTVLGITGAISGVTPEVLEQSLSTVTDGLALAFDATALALGLTMLTMFLSFLVEKSEQGVHDDVDRFAEKELAHRFTRMPSENNAVVEMARKQTEVLVEAVQELVQKQAMIWKQSFEEAERLRAESEAKPLRHLTDTIGTALDQTLQAHHARLSAMEKQVVDSEHGIDARLREWTSVLTRVSQEQQNAERQLAASLARQASAIEQLQKGSETLSVLQASMDANLATLASAETLEETLHGLTAAVHLITAKTKPLRPGAAA